MVLMTWWRQLVTSTRTNFKLDLLVLTKSNSEIRANLRMLIWLGLIQILHPLNTMFVSSIKPNRGQAHSHDWLLRMLTLQPGDEKEW
jgi:hypothetical protein